MALLLTMIPIYVFGNFHCLGMCGPLVMMIGHHRFRYWYFLGRMISFSLAGYIAGGIGEVAGIVFHHYHVSMMTSVFFGGTMMLLGMFTLLKWQYPGYAWLGARLAKTNQSLSLLLLQDNRLSTFLFGSLTLLLPCGQTLIVFSACALSGDAIVGLINGFSFALITSPSLFLAMQAHKILKYAKKYESKVIGVSALMTGALSIWRGFLEWS